MKKNRNYFVCDAHCDTAGAMYKPFKLYQNDTHLDLKRMMEYEKWIQVFAIWTEPEQEVSDIRNNYEKTAAKLYDEILQNCGYIQIIHDLKTLIDTYNSDKCGAVIGIEGGEIIDGDIEYIDKLYRDNVCVITLTWNYTNRIGTGAAEENPIFGLTDFGRSVVRKMNENKMIVDVSHSSEKTFWDVLEISALPVMASHSNSKTLCRSPRNLSDEQFCALVGLNGFTGINFYPPFLCDNKKAGVSDIIRHIEYFAALGGENNIGLGSDFDGIDSAPKGMNGVSDVYKIADELLRLNYSEETVKKIMGKNFYDFLIRCFSENIR